MSILNRFRANDTPYIEYKDNEEDPEEGFSDSYVLQQTTKSIPSSSRNKSPNSFQPFTVNRQQQKYQQLQQDYDETEIESDQESNEAPASLIIETPPNNNNSSNNNNNYSNRQTPKPGMDITELTMWKWVNVENLDTFLDQVYSYYIGKGIYCILLSRFLNLLTLGFVMGFSIFLLGCVDYSLVHQSRSLTEVIIPKCVSQLSGWSILFLGLFSIFWIFQIVRFLLDIRRLIDMYNFYTYLLKIEDVDMQTVSWQHVVNKIIQIKDNNPITSQGSNINIPQQRLDAINITNRIMRQENYFVALFNRELLNLTIPIPISFFQKRNILTKTLEWNLSFCIQNYVFNEEGQVRKKFRTKNTERDKLSKGLRNRFIFMGILNLIFSPFIVIYLILYFFFRYFEEFRSNPGSLFSRKWSPYARWKFREFNELPHLFNQRIAKSYKSANKYVDQFPKEKTILLTRFIIFIVGSFAAVLILASYIDPELLIFEISNGRTVLFYTGIFIPILVVTRGTIPDDHIIFVPEERLKKVVEHTHYAPNGWTDRMHTDGVRREFNELFVGKQIIDFFREFTVHVDGLGYVCSFAVFDFKRHGNLKYGAPVEVNNEYYLSKDGKMEKSFLNFKANHPDWEPADPTGSLYLNNLSRLTEVNNNVRPQHRSNYSSRMPALDSIIKSNRRSGNIHFQNGSLSTLNFNNNNNINSNILNNHHNYNNNNYNNNNYNNNNSNNNNDNINNISNINNVRIPDETISISEDGPSRNILSTNILSHPDYHHLTSSSVNSSQEFYAASDMSDSYSGADIPLTESIDQDRPRNGGVIGLLNQFYELNHSSM